MNDIPGAKGNVAEALAEPAVAGQPVVVSKEELLAALQHLLVYCREYGELLDAIADTAEWREKVAALFLAHAERVQAGDPSLERAGLVMSLIRFVLQRIGQERFVFKLPSRVGRFPEEENAQLMDLSNNLREWSDPVRLMMADIPALDAAAAPEERERMRLILATIEAFFKAVVRQDWDDVALLLSHLNLVTTSREHHELVEQVARIARDIYNSLNRFSEEISYQALTTTTEEIPDAVGKLHSVMERLEEAANANLDSLERMAAQLRESQGWIEEGRQVIAACDADLERLMKEQPRLCGEWESIRQTLRSEVQTKLELLDERIRSENEVLLGIMSNQSFQDLTGQTLRRVIDFIESLQLHLIEVLKRHIDLKPAQKAEPVAEGKAERPPPQSQEQVDQLLTDLGF